MRGDVATAPIRPGAGILSTMTMRRVHFVGIGGIGMSGIAEILISLGYAVSGSDLAASEVTRRLVRRGARFGLGHEAGHLGDADVVVVSSAVGGDNVELLAARERGILVVHRCEMLAALVQNRRGVAVAGSHGKTTSSSLIAAVLTAGGLDPSLVIGGWLEDLDSNARLGQGRLIVVETDESDGSFLKLAPEVGVVTSIDREHLDHYAGLEAIQDAFTAFLNGVAAEGFCAVCHDERPIREILPRVSRRVVTYGLDGGAAFTARAVRARGLGSEFVAERRGLPLGPITIPMPGDHNVRNALAAIAVGVELEIPFLRIQKALREFGGVRRRFQIKGEAGGVMVVDDYAHHPTEIQATLRAARRIWPDRRLLVLFQPHRYSRTQALGREFSAALAAADAVVVTEVYAAGEPPVPGVSGAAIAEGLRVLGHEQTSFISPMEKLPERLLGLARQGDVVLTLGAGDVWRAGETLLGALGDDGPRRAARESIPLACGSVG